MSDYAVARKIAHRIYREEGFGTLITKLALYACRPVFQSFRVCVYEHAIATWNEDDFRPHVPGLEVRIVSSNREADALPFKEDFRDFFICARAGLYRGAVAFVFFINGEFAHASWIALNATSKQIFDRVPFEVDFDNGEACTGGTWTRPKFRGRGLMTYGCYLRIEYLRQHGYRRFRNSVVIGNTASERAQAKFNPVIRRCGRYIKLGRWTYWKERRVAS